MKSPCLGPEGALFLRSEKAAVSAYFEKGGPGPVSFLRVVKFFLLLAAVSALLGGCALFRCSGAGLAAAQEAKKHIGVPYKLGGKTPKSFDCSGLALYVYNRQGVELPRSSSKQAKTGKPIKKALLRPGDLVFFSTGKKGVVSHVGIYVGDGKFVHAPGTGKKVTTSSLSSDYYKKTYHSARRVAL